MDSKDTQILQQNKILLGGQTINLRARQMIYVLAALMDKDRPTNEIVVPTKDFLEFINNTTGEKWSDIYQITSDIFDHLNKNPILIKEPRKKDFVKVNWLSSLGVLKGEIKARFSADIAEFFLYRQGLPYTKLLWDLRLYRSSFTARIMDLFQRFHDQQSNDPEFTFEYEYEELRLFFGVHKKYKRPSDFKKRILETARKELEANDSVPYWFTYEEIRKGKALAKIIFTVYVRTQVLLDKIPALQTLRGRNTQQSDIFDAQRDNTFSKTQKKVYDRLLQLDIPKGYAQQAVTGLSDSQAVGFYYLVEYGVNRNLALLIIQKHCSFGELEGNEHLYVKHTLDLIEEARLKRIKDAASGKSQKRVTPDDKKGGLPKKVFEQKQHFASFMEKQSQWRQEERPQQRQRKGFSSVGDVLKNISSNS
ncbi:MAG: replication initiation protein [Bacteroidota bacterium]